MLALEIHPSELKSKLDQQQAVVLIDCREEVEFGICRIEGAELIPMNSTPQHLSRIDDKADDNLVVVYCHHGMRSLSVVNWLRGQGVENVVSLNGGIDRWSMEIDPQVPRY
jgi:rhodanese-related sulfurtransferase